MIELKNNPAGNFFLLAGPCVIEGEEMAMRIAERVVGITEKLQIPYVFKGSYRKATVRVWIHSQVSVTRKHSRY